MKIWHLALVAILFYALGIWFPGPGQKLKAAVSGVTGGA